MNERIKELWSQAGGHYNGGNQHTWPEYTITDPEKFAELIVRECMDIAKKVEDDSFNVAGAEHEYRKGLNDGRKNAAWGIKNRMKLHFGVEE